MATLRTVTVKSSGGDYLSQDAAYAGEAADITAATGSDEIVRVDCYPFEDTKDCIIDDTAWVTSPTNYVEVRFVDSAGVPLYTKKWSTSAYRLVGKSEVFENNQIDHLWHTQGTFQIMDNLGTGTSTFGILKVSAANSGWSRFDGGGILIANHNSGTAVRGFKVDSGTACRWRNWISYGGDKETVFSPAVDVPAGSGGGPTLEFENCTFDNWETLNFIADAGTTVIYKNCRATNIRDNLAPAGHPNVMDPSSDYNITDRAPTNESNWGTNSIDSSDSPTIDYVDDTNADFTLRDYSLNSSSDSAYQAGTDLSGSFTKDILNVTRTAPWDMGAHELSVVGTPTLATYGWRLRDDNGIEGSGGATFMQIEDTAIEISATGDVGLDTNFRIRMGLDESNTGDPATGVVQVRAKINSGAAFDVNAASTGIRMSASANFADGAATTDHGLAAPAGTFLAGEILETDGSTTSLNLAQNQYTIIEACVQARSADLSSGDSIEFGLRLGGIDYFPGAAMATIGVPAIPTNVAANGVGNVVLGLSWTDPNTPDVPIRAYFKKSVDSIWILDATLAAGTVSHTFGTTTPLIAGTNYDIGVSAWDDPAESAIVSVTSATTNISGVSFVHVSS